VLSDLPVLELPALALAAVDLWALAPLLLLAGFCLIVSPFLDRASDRSRTLVALLTGAVGVRYLIWRITETVVPLEAGPLETAWVWGVFAVELLAFLEVGTFLLVMSRANRESGLADRRQAELESGGRYPSVDVFIPTYNEGLDVLEKSIVGARALDYPDFKVWVLDDGRRNWLRDFCAAKGVGYLTRPDNAHAKAGNLNNGLARTDGALVAVFDADFVPHANFLRRTVGLFADPEIGLVQTPQHFFNKDPVQMNLHIPQDWPDEQRLFFDEMAASRDAWDAAFCCGSCSIMRRAAVEAIGGIPTASITEDLLTTLAMRRRGYKTRYLNERLSIGLAAEGLEAFFIQRGRWAQGGIQTIFLADGPLGRGVGPLHRLLFFPTSWLVQYLVRFAALIVPVAYLLTGLVPLHFTTLEDLLFFQLPALIAFALSMRWFVGRKYVPLLSTAVGIFATFRLLPTVLASLVRPFGTPFRVTPKGTLSRAGVDWVSFAAIMGMALLTGAGLALNSFPGLPLLEERQFFPVAAAWALLNLGLLILAALICFDAPRKRKEERFGIRRVATVRLGSGAQGEGGRATRALVLDLSLSGIGLQIEREAPTPAWAEVELPGIAGVLGGPVVRDREGRLAVAFRPMPEATRDSLIAYLFSGAFSVDPPEGEHKPRLLRNLWNRFAGQPAT
jgi:cellulose synthase (UDP-forming)